MCEYINKIPLWYNCTWTKWKLTNTNLYLIWKETQTLLIIDMYIYKAHTDYDKHLVQVVDGYM